MMLLPCPHCGKNFDVAKEVADYIRIQRAIEAEKQIWQGDENPDAGIPYFQEEQGEDDSLPSYTDTYTDTYTDKGSYGIMWGWPLYKT